MLILKAMLLAAQGDSLFMSLPLYPLIYFFGCGVLGNKESYIVQILWMNIHVNNKSSCYYLVFVPFFFFSLFILISA